jgi:hypothetical protein
MSKGSISKKKIPTPGKGIRKKEKEDARHRSLSCAISHNETYFRKIALFFRGFPTKIV